jgi:hypothetical protein
MLDRLGNTPDEVADALRASGIKGVRNTVRFLNPVVRYVQGQLTGVRDMDLIQPHRLRIEFANATVREVPVPDAVRGFLDGFHRGAYPDLELPPGSA